MKLSRHQLELLPRESLHEARNWSKADVSVAQWPPESGQRVVIKDLRKRPLWYRMLAGRYFLWREWRALCVLKDLDCIPNPVARPDADCFVIEHKLGRQMEMIAPEAMPFGVSAKVERIVALIHARGVTHGDLHSYNILVDENGEVALIDWATACVFGKNPSGAKRLAFEEWCALDERALAKVKIMLAPQELTERERDLIQNGGSRLYRFVKRFKTGYEKIRGVDAERIASRAAKQELYLSRLSQAPQPPSQNGSLSKQGASNSPNLSGTGETQTQ
jgi:hypothetical protein